MDGFGNAGSDSKKLGGTVVSVQSCPQRNWVIYDTLER